MAELKTRRNRGSVKEFLSSVENTARREDARAVMALMEEVAGEGAEM